MRNKVIKMLIEMKMPTNLRGFEHICEAMELFEKYGGYADVKITAVYAEIGKKHGIGYMAVERRIRHAFGKSNALEYLGAVNGTNKALLTMMYLRLREE